MCLAKLGIGSSQTNNIHTKSLLFQAYELSTLTGTQVMLLVASETGHVYTFATPKLQPMITSGKLTLLSLNLHIQFFIYNSVVIYRLHSPSLFQSITSLLCILL